MAQFYASNKLEKMGKRKKRNLSFAFRFLISGEKLIRSKKEESETRRLDEKNPMMVLLLLLLVVVVVVMVVWKNMNKLSTRTDARCNRDGRLNKPPT